MHINDCYDTVSTMRTNTSFARVLMEPKHTDGFFWRVPHIGGDHKFCEKSAIKFSEGSLLCVSVQLSNRLWIRFMPTIGT